MAAPQQRRRGEPDRGWCGGPAAGCCLQSAAPKADPCSPSPPHVCSCPRGGPRPKTPPAASPTTTTHPQASGSGSRPAAPPPPRCPSSSSSRRRLQRAPSPSFLRSRRVALLTSLPSAAAAAGPPHPPHTAPSCLLPCTAVLGSARWVCVQNRRSGSGLLPRCPRHQPPPGCEPACKGWGGVGARC